MFKRSPQTGVRNKYLGVVYYGTHKLVLEINGGGIIYIYTRTRAQTETQSLTYGVARARFLTQIFGVLVDGLTAAPTLWTCGSLCRVFVCCWLSLSKRGTITAHILPPSPTGWVHDLYPMPIYARLRGHSYVVSVDGYKLSVSALSVRFTAVGLQH